MPPRSRSRSFIRCPLDQLAKQWRHDPDAPLEWRKHRASKVRGYRGEMRLHTLPQRNLAAKMLIVEDAIFGANLKKQASVTLIRGLSELNRAHHSLGLLKTWRGGRGGPFGKRRLSLAQADN